MCVCLYVSVRVCLAMASASLAAGISQSRDRTCCLSGRRVAIVTLSASLRCFWETIPHPNQPVWVPATGHISFFPLPVASLSVSFPFFCLFSPSSSLWTQSEVSGCNRWPRSALWGTEKNERRSAFWVFLKLEVCLHSSFIHMHTRHVKVLTSPGDAFWLWPCVTSPHLSLRFLVLIALLQSHTSTPSHTHTHAHTHTHTHTHRSFCSVFSDGLRVP